MLAKYQSLRTLFFITSLPSSDKLGQIILGMTCKEFLLLRLKSDENSLKLVAEAEARLKYLLVNKS